MIFLKRNLNFDANRNIPMISKINISALMFYMFKLYEAQFEYSQKKNKTFEDF